MALNSIYKKYFQKSKVFLYPLLGIKRGTSVIPTETYVSWGDVYFPEDMKLICVYHIRDDHEYVSFEKNVLLKHTRLHDFIKVDDITAVYVFDFSDLTDDWFHFINGKYSKINMNLKHTILSFFDKYSGNYAYMYSYLYPEKHFDTYANLLEVDVDLLKKVGELCSKPDLEKEMFLIQVANLQDISNSQLNL
jgi:hypothetical protein